MFKVGDKVVFSKYGKKSFFGNRHEQDTRSHHTYTIIYVRRLRDADRDRHIYYYDVQSDKDIFSQWTTLSEEFFEPLRKLIKKRDLPNWW